MLPCLNEAATIGPLVEAIRGRIPRVFVVDDGSTDSTSAEARKAGALVAHHPVTLGKGAALQAGCRRALDQGCLWALTMDGDGQHCPDDIPAFFACADRTGAALVVGNRMDHASQIPLVRRWVNRWMSRKLSALTGLSLPDSQCGFRLVQLEHWARLPILASHFEIESEFLFAFAQAHLAIEFVPVQPVYKTERSKIHPFVDTVRWLRWWRRARQRQAQAVSAGPATGNEK